VEISEPKGTKEFRKLRCWYTAEVPFETILAQHLKDPKVRRAYEELEPEFEIVRQIIDLRIKRKMTQAQLAKRVGTAQPNIARLENRRHPSKEIDLLRRVAAALDAKLEVRLVPRKAGATKASSRRTKRA
jgi:DNA-binding XRE family transcriptional regulator